MANRLGPAHPRATGMERRRRLADLLAITAGELLQHCLDHLPLARYHFQRLRRVLAELAKTSAAAALASRRPIDHHPLPGKVFGEGLALGALAHKSAHSRRLGHGTFRRKLVVLGGVDFQLFERQRQLFGQPRRTLRPLPIDLML